MELVSASANAPPTAGHRNCPSAYFRRRAYAHKELAQYFRVNSFFIAENVRDIIQEGLGDYTPVFLSDIPRLFDSGQLPLDVALIHVTPPDAHGMCASASRWTSFTPPPRTLARHRQVNPKMPRTLAIVSSTSTTLTCCPSSPILEVPPAEATETTRQIAEYIAALIEDVPPSSSHWPHSAGDVWLSKDKKDLGVHNRNGDGQHHRTHRMRRHHRKPQVH